MEEEKVIIKLKKEPLKSEREEIKNKKKHKLLIVLLCVFLFASGVGVGYGVFVLKNKTNTSVTSSTKFSEIKETLKSVWLYRNDYEDLDSVIEDKAYYGMTSFDEDPYTTYMSKEENTSFNDSINMNYYGIGLQFYIYEGTVSVTRVFKDSPAEKGGILKNDILKKIDGVDISNMSSDEIKSLVLGAEGTVVNVTVERIGKEIELPIIRGEVASTIYCEAENDIVILDIISFGEDSADEAIKYLDDYKDYKKIIIDLRDNSGGLQSAVSDLVGLFVGKDVVYMNQEYNNGVVTAAKTKSKCHYENFEDIVILVDENTASAAEVFTLALKEQLSNVTVVGNTTFGKGVVQSRYSLIDGSTLKITTSKWTSPNGVDINGEGIEPDVKVLLDDIFYISVPNMEEDEYLEYDSVSSKTIVAQKGLIYIGYNCDRNDGYFDKDFEKVIDAYKLEHNLKADHKLDKETYELILKEVAHVYATDKSKDSQLNKAKELLG